MFHDQTKIGRLCGFLRWSAPADSPGNTRRAHASPFPARNLPLQGPPCRAQSVSVVGMHDTRTQKRVMYCHAGSTGVQGVRGGGGGGAMSWQVQFAVVNFAVGNLAEAPGCCVVNFADTPRNVVVYRALQARWSLATGAILCGRFRSQFGTRKFPHEIDCPKSPLVQCNCVLLHVCTMTTSMPCDKCPNCVPQGAP